MLIMQRLGICTGKMEEGALRVDANVSIHKENEPLGTRTEIKNIGSVRGVASAIRCEIDRQLSVLSNGQIVVNETRSWDAASRLTVPMRDKEIVQDYRYMPEPNLPPLRVNLSTKEETNDVISVPLIKDSLPELPEKSRQNLINQYNLRPEMAIQLVNEPILQNHFHNLMKSTIRKPTKVANLLTNDYLTVLNKRKINLDESPINLDQLGEVIDLLLDKKISLEVSRQILDDLVENQGLSPNKIVNQKGLSLVDNVDEIRSVCLKVLDDNPNLVQQYKDGKTKVFKAFLGLISKSSNNKLDMSLVSKTLMDLLKGGCK